MHFDPEQLILTTSTSEGYSFVFRLLCNPGDELLVPKPSYPLFEFLGRLAGCQARAVSADLRSRLANGFSFAAKKLLRSARAAWLWFIPIIPPVRMCIANEKEFLNRFCREHELALIADEVFLDYAHDGVPQRKLCRESGRAHLYAQRSF